MPTNRPPATRKKKKPDWAQIRAEFEAGASINGLAGKFGVNKSTVQYRQAKEQWVQGVAASINRQAEEKLAGISASADPQKKAPAIAEEAERKVAILAKHRSEWMTIRKMMYEILNPDQRDELGHRIVETPAIIQSRFEKAKLAKISSETLQIMQTGERKAWGLSDPIQQAPDTGQQQERTQTAMVAINSLLSQIVIEKHGNAGHGQAPRPKD